MGRGQGARRGEHTHVFYDSMAFISLPTVRALGDAQRIPWRNSDRPQSVSRTHFHSVAVQAKHRRRRQGWSCSMSGGGVQVRKQKRARGADNPHSRSFVKEVRCES